MKPEELAELLDITIKKARQEAIREIIEYADRFFTWDEEGFVRNLKERYGDELEGEV